MDPSGPFLERREDARNSRKKAENWRERAKGNLGEAGKRKRNGVLRCRPPPLSFVFFPSIQSSRSVRPLDYTGRDCKQSIILRTPPLSQQPHSIHLLCPLSLKSSRKKVCFQVSILIKKEMYGI